MAMVSSSMVCWFASVGTSAVAPAVAFEELGDVEEVPVPVVEATTAGVSAAAGGGDLSLDIIASSRRNWMFSKDSD